MSPKRRGKMQKRRRAADVVLERYPLVYSQRVRCVRGQHLWVVGSAISGVLGKGTTPHAAWCDARDKVLAEKLAEELTQ